MNPVQAFYDSRPEEEWGRLERRRLEYAITMRALEEHLPPPPARIADVGGASGRYAIELARRGYGVTLVDLSARCLDFAGVKADEAGVTLEGCLHADARDLSALPDASFDAVLLMGPLYHLVEPESREKAVHETHRILRPGGKVIAAFLIRYNSITNLAVREPSNLPRYRDIEETILNTGEYRMTEDGGFTDAWFCHPTEIPPLMEAGGFRMLEAISCEATLNERDGPVSEMCGDLWERWVDILYRIAKDPTIHGAAGHLLTIGRK